jgi:hypothetical protein
MLSQLLTDLFGNGPIRVVVVVGLICAGLAIKANRANARDQSFGHEPEPEPPARDGDTVPIRR